LSECFEKARLVVVADKKTREKIASKYTAKKRDPEKWEAAKREAKAKMGGKHSARAMQLAAQIYKKKGGRYAGKKPSAKDNSLKKWTKQDWEWSGESRGRGVYLPKKKVEKLKSSAESGSDKTRRAVQQARARSRHEFEEEEEIG
jgi:hypothetical protein